MDIWEVIAVGSNYRFDKLSKDGFIKSMLQDIDAAAALLEQVILTPAISENNENEFVSGLDICIKLFPEQMDQIILALLQAKKIHLKDGKEVSGYVFLSKNLIPWPGHLIQQLHESTLSILLKYFNKHSSLLQKLLSLKDLKQTKAINPHFASEVMKSILRRKSHCRELINSTDQLIDAKALFPEHADLLLQKVINDRYQYSRMYHGAASIKAIISAYPNEKDRILSKIFSHPEHFRRLFTMKDYHTISMPDSLALEDFAKGFPEYEDTLTCLMFFYQGKWERALISAAAHSENINPLKFINKYLHRRYYAISEKIKLSEQDIQDIRFLKFIYDNNYRGHDFPAMLKFEEILDKIWHNIHVQKTGKVRPLKDICIRYIANHTTLFAKKIRHLPIELKQPIKGHIAAAKSASKHAIPICEPRKSHWH